MALSAQMSPTQALVTFALWARRNGYSVGEMHGFSTVHRVHMKGSWHYDKDGGYGKAADINKNGPDEHASLSHAVDVAQYLGLAVIYARDGVRGVAANHRTHLHVDVGAYSHLGRTSFRPRGGGDAVTVGVQHAVAAVADMVWGSDTNRRSDAVRMASAMHGVQFPYGVAYTQAVVRAEADGVWGNNSRAAHDRIVALIQRALGVADDGVWGPVTDRAFVRARDISWRR